MRARCRMPTATERVGQPALASGAVVQASDLRFAWRKGQPIIDIPALTLEAGRSLFLHGASGSGKSTLIGLIAGVLPLSSGRLDIAGVDMAALSGPGRDRARADRIGVIFQTLNLLPYLSVLANVALPCRVSAGRLRDATARGGVEAEARRLLARLGLDAPGLLARPARALSVGQQQRVAIARALIGSPALIVADEPTSALDPAATERFMELLRSETEATGAALIFVSHDIRLAEGFDELIDLAAINRAGRA